MDPDIALRDLLSYADGEDLPELGEDVCPELPDRVDYEQAFNELVEKIQDLDLWIRRGGFLPARWNVKRS